MANGACSTMVSKMPRVMLCKTRELGTKQAAERASWAGSQAEAAPSHPARLAPPLGHQPLLPPDTVDTAPPLFPRGSSTPKRQWAPRELSGKESGLPRPPATYSLVRAATLQKGSMNLRFWSAVSYREGNGNSAPCLVHNRPPTSSAARRAPPHLLGAHFGQLLQKDLDEVALHPVGGLAVRVQDLGRQQLQQLLDLSEEGKAHTSGSHDRSALLSLPPSVISSARNTSAGRCHRLQTCQLSCPHR